MFFNTQKADKLEAETEQLPETITPKELSSLDESSLKALAQKKSTEITRRIQAVSEKISDSKDMASRAADMKIGGFMDMFGGKTRKKADATADGLLRTNEAMTEMNDLIQESIKFSCTSFALSSIMLKEMSMIIENGFKDSNGEIVKTNKNCTKFVNVLIGEIDRFTQAEKRQVEQEEKLKAVSELSDANDARHDEEIETLQLQTKSIRALSEEKDALHDRQIAELRRDVELLKGNVQGRGAIVLSAIAIVLAVINVIFTFLL